MRNPTAFKPIRASEARIHTATVSMQTIRVDDKSLTLTIYRQLFDEGLIDVKTGTFRGLPWGRVNYYPPPCDKLRDPARDYHTHVIWQLGDDLRRACVPLDAESVPLPARGEFEWMLSAWTTWAQFLKVDLRQYPQATTDAYGQVGWRCCPRAYDPPRNLDDLVRRLLDVGVRDAETEGYLATPDHFAHLTSRLDAAHDTYHRVREAYTARLTEVEALPQLILGA
jgi:hypothetical protein